MGQSEEVIRKSVKFYRKYGTATLLVSFHRIPPPKESMKMLRGESPSEMSIQVLTQFAMVLALKGDTIVVVYGTAWTAPLS